MIAAITIQQASLTDPPQASAIMSATTWISGLLFGPLATSVAVIAIAWVGFAMLSGRIEIRRGLSVVFGCFLLFGAKGIADGLRLAGRSDNNPAITSVPSAPVFTASPATGDTTNAFDPYAGAAVMRQGQ
jgi:type IV secretion system protein VirB2